MIKLLLLILFKYIRVDGKSPSNFKISPPRAMKEKKCLLILCGLGLKRIP